MTINHLLRFIKVFDIGNTYRNNRLMHVPCGCRRMRLHDNVWLIATQWAWESTLNAGRSHVPADTTTSHFTNSVSLINGFYKKNKTFNKTHLNSTRDLV